MYGFGDGLQARTDSPATTVIRPVISSKADLFILVTLRFITFLLYIRLLSYEVSGGDERYLIPV